MPTFKFRKNVDEVEEPELMPVDWYPVELYEDPTLEANATLRDAVDDLKDTKAVDAALKADEKAGFNMILRLAVESEDPRFDGRKLRLWLPYPSEYDLERYDSRGMLVYDAKMERIIKFAEKFGSGPEGDEVDIYAGMKGRVYIEQRRSQNREGLENAISMFAGFKSYDEEDGWIDTGAADGAIEEYDDDVPL